jgi:26S proteasome regulatory subunit N3
MCLHVYIYIHIHSDGVIEASLDHEAGCLVSNEVADLYLTDEPQRAFHRRIVFCLDVHNDAVRSMRYPPADYKKMLLADAAAAAASASRSSGGGGGDKDKKKKEEEEEPDIDQIIKEIEDEMDEV